MRRGFADTHFYLALRSRRDAGHARAREIFARGEFAELVTTTGGFHLPLRGTFCSKSSPP